MLATPRRLTAALTLTAALSAPLAAEQGYAWVRTVDGYSEHEVTAAGAAERFQAASNYPLTEGDRLWVPAGSRLEAVLADGTLLRLGGATDLVPVRIAGALDSFSDATVLEVGPAEMQITRPSGSGPERLEVAAAGVRLVLESPGRYRVSLTEDGWLRLIVRDGWAEVATRTGSAIVRTAEAAWIEPGVASVDIGRAPAWDDLELWAEDLDGQARVADVGPIEEDLAYAAAPLADHGSWVRVSGVNVWMPAVEDDWRPYTSGRWSYTPVGVTWVAYEPWGWVTHHYGSWDYAPGYGWVWYPGSVYSPAWVYWYWGPTHVAWVPAGYYAGYYASWHHLPVTGVWGFAGGGWNHWHYWTFCDRRYFGHRDDRHHYRSGRDLARLTDRSVVPRGVIATDTRGLTPRLWRDPAGAERALASRTRGRGLEDMSDFVARSAAARPRAAGLFRERPAVRSVAGRADVRSAAGADVRPEARSRPGVSPVQVRPGDRSLRPSTAGRDPVRVLPRPGTGRDDRWDRSGPVRLGGDRSQVLDRPAVAPRDDGRSGSGVVAPWRDGDAGADRESDRLRVLPGAGSGVRPDPTAGGVRGGGSDVPSWAARDRDVTAARSSLVRRVVDDIRRSREAGVPARSPATAPPPAPSRPPTGVRQAPRPPAPSRPPIGVREAPRPSAPPAASAARSEPSRGQGQATRSDRSTASQGKSRSSSSDSSRPRRGSKPPV